MAAKTKFGNMIQNGNFQIGRLGALPEGWRLNTPNALLAPKFVLARKQGRKMLRIEGNGQADCYGYLATPVTLKAGRTYQMRVRFRMSSDVNPQWHLRFSFFANESPYAFNNGIFRFRRCKGGYVEGENRFKNTTGKNHEVDIRICYNHNPSGKVFVESISLKECDPISPRPVKIATTGGKGGMDVWSRVLDAAGKAKVDLVLLPETLRLNEAETRRGPVPTLLSQKAKQYGMYTAGGFNLREKGRVYNTCMLFDRKGRLAGRYDKIHPYTPEFWETGVTPGKDAPVFQTDFGKVGILICYDSWFPDVTELLALKGAEIVLFPNMGYYRSIMPARASDNCVRMVVSSQNRSIGIWDTAGREITDPETDPSNGACMPISATARTISQKTVAGVKLLSATLDLSNSPSPANWGGPFMSSPGGRRNRREQLHLLYDEIQKEQQRWWEE